MQEGSSERHSSSGVDVAASQGAVEEHFDGVISSEWLRMSAWSIFFITIKLIWVLFIQNWSLMIGLFVFLSSRENLLLWSVISGLGILSFFGVMGFLRFLRFRFSWDETHLYVRSGVLNRKTLRIPFERIQSVDTTQNILHQALGLVELKLDTAGSKGKEADISAVKLSIAQELSEAIYAFKESEKAKEQAQVDAQVLSGQTVEAHVEDDTEERELFRLSLKDLLLYGLFENHFQTFAIILAFGFTIYGQLQDTFDEAAKVVEENSKLLVQLLEAHLFVGITLLVLFSILLTILISMVRLTLTHFDLRFFETERGYRKVAGLFTRKKKSLGKSKVQMVQWRTNPLKKLMDMYAFDLTKATSGATADINDALNNRFYIPALRSPQIAIVIERLLKVELPDFSAHSSPVHVQYIFRRTLYIGVFPALIASLQFFIGDHWQVLPFAAAWIALIGIAAFLFQRNFRLIFDQDCCFIQKGIIGRRYQAFEWYKVHNVELKNSPHQRRKGLCSVVLHTAGEKARILYVSYADAVRLREMVLWRVNTTQKDWM